MSPAVDPPKPPYTVRLPFKTINSHTIHLEAWLPSEEQIEAAGTGREGKGVPVVVWLHGGGFFDGAAGDCSLPNLLPTLARGWAFVALEYRLVPQVTLHQCVEDVKDGCEFVRSGKLDAALGGGRVEGERLAVTGASAGAALAIFASYTLSPPPRVVYSLYGGCDLSSPSYHTRVAFPSGPISYSEVASHLSPDSPVVSSSPAEVDFSTLVAQGRTRACFWAVQEGKATELAVPGLTEGAEDPKLAPFIATSLIRSASDPRAQIPPTVCVHGTADLMVPFEISERLVGALEEAGVDALLIREEGANHGFDLIPGVVGDREKMKCFDEANDFVAKYI
ncbi:hypothetical protein JCM1841_002091 [Sporobolomyces salmonicolor]